MLLGQFKKYLLPLKSPLLESINFRSILGFFLSGILLWLTFYNSGLRLRDLSMSGADFLNFFLADLFFITSVWVYSIRTKLFWLNEKRQPGDIHSFESVVVGNFYNCLLPGNLGDGMRAWHFSKKNKIPFLQSLSSIIAEKWIDAQFFVLLTIFLFIIMPFEKHYIFFAIIYTSITVVCLTIVYTLMRQYSSIEKKVISIVLLFRKTGKFIYRIYWFTTRLITDLLRKHRLGKYVLCCIVIYVLNVLQFFFLFRASGVSAPVGGLYGAYLIAVCMMIIAIIPSAPSNIGVLHYGIYAALILSAAQHGITPNAQNLQSYARYAVYVHLSYVIPEVIMGLLYVIKERKVLFEVTH